MKDLKEILIEDRIWKLMAKNTEHSTTETGGGIWAALQAFLLAHMKKDKPEM